MNIRNFKKRCLPDTFPVNIPKISNMAWSKSRNTNGLGLFVRPTFIEFSATQAVWKAGMQRGTVDNIHASIFKLSIRCLQDTCPTKYTTIVGYRLKWIQCPRSVCAGNVLKTLFGAGGYTYGIQRGSRIIFSVTACTTDIFRYVRETKDSYTTRCVVVTSFMMYMTLTPLISW